MCAAVAPTPLCLCALHTPVPHTLCALPPTGGLSRHEAHLVGQLARCARGLLVLRLPAIQDPIVREETLRVVEAELPLCSLGFA